MALLALAVCSASSTRVRAHGPPPSPLALLAADDDGARAVRLSRGIALREAVGPRFVCPALWGSDDTGLVVAGAIPDGPLAVASAASIALIADDGTVTQHPDTAAIGRVIAFAASSTALYALQARHGRSEVIQLSAGRAQLVWSDPESFSDLAANDDALVLLRFGAADLVQLELTPDGETQATQQVLAPDMTAALFARVAGATPYVLVAAQGGALLELGRVRDGMFDVLQRARGNLAGPVETAGGKRFVAIEGVLNRFDGDEAAALDDPEFVTCLDAAQGQRYACTRTQIRALDDDGLGAALFDVSQLLAPDPARVPAAIKAECDAQWQHYRFDLLAAGIDVPDAPDSSADAGSTALDAGGGAAGSGARDDAGSTAEDAGSGDDRAPPARHDNDGGGCSAAHALGSAPHPARPPAAALALAFVYVVRRRAASRVR
jgi:hypothetical protein